MVITVIKILCCYDVISFQIRVFTLVSCHTYMSSLVKNDICMVFITGQKMRDWSLDGP